MTNEFKVGQVVSGHDYDNLPLGAQVTLGDNWFTHTKISGNRWRNDIGRVEPSGKYRRIARTLAHLPEPEDETDAYVEPEPLKEGDWVRVWAQVDRTRLDSDGDLVITTPGALGEPVDTAYIRPDAIVRPDAGQVPPWVKPTRCTSLLAVEDGERLLRCARDEHGAEVYHWNDAVETWADAEAYGRVEVAS